MENPPASDAKPDNSIWIYAVIGVLIAGLVAAALFLLLSGDDKKRIDRGPSRGAGIKQADWKIRLLTARGFALPEKGGSPSKGDAKQLRRLVRTVYGAVYLRPQLIGRASKKYLSKEAANALKTGNPHIPDKARRIKTLRRVAVIGYDPATKARAAAKVSVMATGLNKGKRFRAVTHDRLWLERSHRKWRIIAFNVNLDALPVTTDDGKKDGKGDDSKRDKKKGAKKDGKGDDSKRDKKEGAKKDGATKKAGRKDSKS